MHGDHAWAACESRGSRSVHRTIELVSVNYVDTVLTDLDTIQATESRTAFSNTLEKIGLRYSKELKSIVGKLPLPW